MSQLPLQCVFCLDDMTDEKQTIALQGCEHVVHTACFMEYIKHNSDKNVDILCPICRHIVVNIDNNTSQVTVTSTPQTPQLHIVPQALPPPIQHHSYKLRCLTPCFIIFVISINIILIMTLNRD